MLLGVYYHQIDEKNRLRLPKKLKAELSSAMIIKGSHNCLYILPSAVFDKIMQKANDLPMFGPAQDSLRLILSSACEIVEDNQGRFLLPQTLKSWSGIQKDVVFVGVGNRVELWDRKSWEDYYNQKQNDYDNLLLSLGEYGI